MTAYPEIDEVLAGTRDWCVVTGDARIVLPTLPAASIDMVFADPPYGHNNNNGDLIHRREAALGRGPVVQEDARAIANDGPEANDLMRAVLPEWLRILRPGCCCCCCCCGGGGPDPQFARWSLWMDEVFAFKQMVVWDKGGLGMGWHYRRSYETVLVGEKPGAACHWFGGNATSNVCRVPKIIPSADQHPTEKPWQLAAWFLKVHSEPGDVVLDSFAGRGSTGEACLRTGRRFIGIESDSIHAAKARQKLASTPKPLFHPAAPAPAQQEMFQEPPPVAVCTPQGAPTP